MGTINSKNLGQEKSVYYVSFEQWQFISSRIKAAVKADNLIGETTITVTDWQGHFSSQIAAGTMSAISDNIVVSRLCDFHIKQIIVSTINDATVAQIQNPVNAKAVKDYIASNANFNFVTSNNSMLFNNGTTNINSFCSPEGRLTFIQDTTDPTKIKIEVVSPKVETLV